MTPRDLVVDIPEPAEPVLSAPLTPSFDYTRSTGPVLGTFFTGLRDGRIVGTRDSRGAVHVPPVEFDPETHQTLGNIVEVADEGEVTSWSWVAEPSPLHPMDRPFAWALVQFDGADTSMLLPVDAESAEECSTGMRVRVRWADHRTGSVRDLTCVPATAQAEVGHRPVSVDGAEPITSITTPVGLAVTHTAGPAESVFLRAIVEGRLVGRRRSNGPEVYVPPRDYCPSDGVLMGEFVEVSDHGTVTTFAIVNVPFAGQTITPPYVTAYILLDGADLPVQHLVLGCEAADVHMGMRVRAVWAPEGERPASMRAIRHFEPSGEPDADPDSYSEHL